MLVFDRIREQSMQSWKIFFIVFERDGSFEAEGVNAAVAGVGATPIEAVGSLHRMAQSMAVLASEHKAKLTADPATEDKALFDRLLAGKVPHKELLKLGIAAYGGFDLQLQRLKRNRPTELGSGKLELELVGGQA